MNAQGQYNLREAVREVLKKHGLFENVQLEFDLMTMFRAVLGGNTPGVSPNPDDHRQSTLNAMTAGMSKDEIVKADWSRLFVTTPNWNTKTGRAFIVWAKERAERGETLDRFAEWWYENDWRGKDGSPPTLNLVMEFWNLAHNPGSRKSDTRGHSTPEGL